MYELTCSDTLRKEIEKIPSSFDRCFLINLFDEFYKFINSHEEDADLTFGEYIQMYRLNDSDFYSNEIAILSDILNSNYSTDLKNKIQNANISEKTQENLLEYFAFFEIHDEFVTSRHLSFGNFISLMFNNKI